MWSVCYCCQILTQTGMYRQIFSRTPLYEISRKSNRRFPKFLYAWRQTEPAIWLYKENNRLRDWKNVFTVHIPPWGPHAYDFVVLTSLTHPRKILLVVLQIVKYEIGKAKDLSALVRNSRLGGEISERDCQWSWASIHPVGPDQHGQWWFSCWTDPICC
jgi:hypothetical protein